MPKDKISMDDLTSGQSFDHWATHNQLDALLSLTQGMPRYHKFMENFAKGMSSGKVGMEKAFRDAGRGMERFAPASKIATEGLERTGASGKKTGDKLSILGAMASGSATRLEQFQRSAARVDGTLKSTYNEFTGLLKMTAGLAGVIGGGIAGLTGLTGVLGGAMGKLGKFGTALTGVGNQIPTIVGIMGAAVGVVMGVVDDFGQSLRKTANFGVSFGQSFMDLRVQLGEAGLGLDNLEKQLAQNSEAFALMGANVHQGIQRFSEWRRQQNALTHVTKENLSYFENLGFAAEDLHDMFLKDFRNRRLSGFSQEQAISLTTKRLKELANEAKNMSELTGENRKLLVQQNIELRSDPQWQAFLSGKSEQHRENLERNLEIMATTMSFTDKQKKAVQDSIRMGGNISLLNESVFGDAFAFLRYMPEQRKLLEDMVKQVATGEKIEPGDLKKSIVGYIEIFGKFFETEQGKFFSMFGKNIIPEMGAIFENLVAYRRLTSTPGALDQLIEGVTNGAGLATSNVMFARQEQASLIMGNLMASEKGKALLAQLEGGTLEQALQGDIDAFNQLKNLMAQTATAEGVITGAIANMTVQAASVVIHAADRALKFFGLEAPGASGLVSRRDENIVSSANTMFGDDGIFMQSRERRRRGFGGDYRSQHGAAGKQAMALQELLTLIHGDDARTQMSNMQTKYQDKMGELHRLHATDENFDLAGGIGKLKEEFKAEIMGAAEGSGIDMNSRRGSNQSFKNRLFSAEEMIDLPLKIAQLKAAEYNLQQTLQDLNKLEQQISKLSANDEVSRNIKVSNYDAMENRAVGQERQIEELNQQINALRETLGIPTEAPNNLTLNTPSPSTGGQPNAWSPAAGTTEIVSAIDRGTEAVLAGVGLTRQGIRDNKEAVVASNNALST